MELPTQIVTRVMKPLQVFVLAGSIALLTACGDKPQSVTPTLPVPTTILTIDPEITRNYPGFESIARLTFQQYFAKYGCNTDSIEIKPRPPYEGIDGSYLALTKDSVINMTPRGLTSHNLYDDVTSHEYSYACIEKEKFDSADQIDLGGGLKIFEFEGFKINLIDEKGEEGTIYYAEEGAAEVFSARLVPDYSPADGKYSGSRSLMDSIVNKYFNGDELRVSSLHQKSDFRGFVAVVLGKDKKDITSEDLIIIINAFNYAAEQSQTPTQIVAAIDKFRAENSR